LGAAAAVKPGVLWGLILAPAAAWGLTLMVNYFLASRFCGPAVVPWMAMVAATMLLIVAVSGARAWQIYGRLRSGDATGTGEHPSGIAVFMAQLGLLAASLFAVAIAAQAITPWLLHDCT
jgi:hypothetical protein